MARKWTRQERRRHIREKYYGWREKALVFVAVMLAVFIVLSLAVTGVLADFSLQLISSGMLIVIIIVFFLVAYGGTKFKIPIFLLLIVFILLLLTAVIVFAGMLSGIEQIVAIIILGLLFIAVIAVSVFFMDLVFYEAL